MGAPKREETDNMAEERFKNFQKLMENIKPQVQETRRIPARIKEKSNESIFRHTIIKRLENESSKPRALVVWKAAKDKSNIIQGERKIRFIADFSFEKCKVIQMKYF